MVTKIETVPYCLDLQFIIYEIVDCMIVCEKVQMNKSKLKKLKVTNSTHKKSKIVCPVY